MNVGTNFCWSGTTYTPDPNSAWHFYFPLRDEIGPSHKTSTTLSVWPVRPGDIGLVPMPSAVWLFGSAPGLMGWMRRRGSWRLRRPRISLDT